MHTSFLRAFATGVASLTSFLVAPSLRAQCTTQWLGGASGADGAIVSIARAGNDLIMSGSFTTIGGVAANRIARRTAAGNFVAIPNNGLSSGSVNTILQRGNGTLVLGGQFGLPNLRPVQQFIPGAVPGTGTWQALGTGLSGAVNAIIELANGDLIAGGAFTVSVGGVQTGGNLARWNGSAWAPLAPNSGVNGTVHALVELPNGDIVCGGQFVSAGLFPLPSVRTLHVARFSPATGSFLQIGTPSTTNSVGVSGWVYALAVDATGDLFVGGEFQTASGVAPGTAINARSVARWNGTAWSAVGTGLGSTQVPNAPVYSLLAHPSGQLIAGGSFVTDGSGTVTLNGIARFNGTAWSSMTAGGGLVNPGFVASGLAMARTTTNDVFVGGLFSSAGGVAASGLAIIDVCNATAVPYGTGCSGSVGPVQLTAQSQPWIGTTFTLQATGAPAGSIAAGIWGATALNQPLSQLWSLALPGCNLLASTELLIGLLPIGGVVTSQWAIPQTPSALGQQFVHQVAVIELDANGLPSAVSSSNGIQFTLGGL